MKLNYEEKYSIKKFVKKPITLFTIFMLLITIITCYNLLNVPRWQTISYDVVAQNEYKEFVFDCDDFSKLLVTKLKEEDYNARMEISNDAKNGLCDGSKIETYEKIVNKEIYCHAWVILTIDGQEINIEATNGMVKENGFRK